MEHIIGVGLCVVYGGTIADNRHIFGMSIAAGYRAFDDFIDAVNIAPALDIKLPTTTSAWERANLGFRAKSTNEIMQGTCLAVDGFFQRTNKPSKKEAPNQLSYYSGHYESYGVNCQAAVFSDLRFAYFGVLSPGLTNDNILYPLAIGLKQVIDITCLKDIMLLRMQHTLSLSICWFNSPG